MGNIDQHVENCHQSRIKQHHRWESYDKYTQFIPSNRQKKYTCFLNVRGSSHNMSPIICKLAQLLINVYEWRSLYKLKIELAYDPEVILLEVYPKEVRIAKWYLVHHRTLHNSHNTQTTWCLSTDKLIQ